MGTSKQTAGRHESGRTSFFAGKLRQAASVSIDQCHIHLFATKQIWLRLVINLLKRGKIDLDNRPTRATGTLG